MGPSTDPWELSRALDQSRNYRVSLHYDDWSESMLSLTCQYKGAVSNCPVLCLHVVTHLPVQRRCQQWSCVVSACCHSPASTKALSAMVLCCVCHVVYSSWNAPTYKSLSTLSTPSRLLHSLHRHTSQSSIVTLIPSGLTSRILTCRPTELKGHCFVLVSGYVC